MSSTKRTPKIKHKRSVSRVSNKADEKPIVSPEDQPRKRSVNRNPNHNNSDLLSKISSIEHLARAMQEIVAEKSGQLHRKEDINEPV